MDILKFWKKQDGKTHITAGDTEFPEGFDLGKKLQSLFKVNEEVIEFGCGYGRLFPFFSPAFYVGYDINKKAIDLAVKNTGFKRCFKVIGDKDNFLDSIDETCDAWLAYTVFLHINDKVIKETLKNMCKYHKIDRFVAVEILGKDRWRQCKGIPVFNRDLKDYVTLFTEHGFYLHEATEEKYHHYKDTNITFMDFRR